MVPHVVRSFTGPDLRWILPYSAVLSPVLLLGADVVGRLVARPAEVQVGIVTAIIGGPVFIYLVRRRKDGPAVKRDPYARGGLSLRPRHPRARRSSLLLLCAALAAASR